ncbi:2-oxoacid ferredoxin oxidoreductase [Actinomadura rubteroloni]|uniref:2-oxoacid ferredoxin oxidoreductase n=1 Tax=Actinomadura rubteroloni TaxID=1926885 RepID=A0A2P4UNJ3_9ACTN|nr:thiamine pyrophosphate-dependent enzyme [Actinomadura rubteroloni]POM26616.1 2-oxoacid ferredoxin oxidoreductase [Actinomadura rubteroloni]
MEPPTTPATCLDVAAAVAGATGRVLAVAGRPVTHLAETLSDLPDFEWAVGEKSAVESAVGLSAAGVRSCAVMKHNGLAAALDPLANAAVHGIGAGLVVVSGDDLDAAASTTLNDSRALGRLAGLPVLDPAGAGDARAAVRDAFLLSERTGVPVIVRVTSALHADCGDGRLRARPGPADAGGRVDRTVAHRLTKLGRHQHRRLVVQPAVQAELDGHTTATCAETCDDAVIAVGAAQRHVTGAGCLLRVRAGWPLPVPAVAFADRHARVLVVEEPLPFAEHLIREAAADRTRVRGRLTGHLPPEGSLSPDLLRRAWADPPGTWTDIAHKPDDQPPPRRYATLYAALAGLDVFVAADVGSSIRLCYPPYSAAEVALGLGSAVAVAGGAARTGRPAIGVIGDYALLHSGMESLLDTALRRLPVLVTVLANGTQAQTGGQPVPPVDLRRLAGALSIGVVDEWEHAALDVAATRRRLAGLLAGPLPALALVRDAA